MSPLDWNLPQSQPIEFYRLDAQHLFFSYIKFTLIVYTPINTMPQEEKWFRRNIYWKLTNVDKLDIQYCNTPPSKVNIFQRLYAKSQA